MLVCDGTQVSFDLLAPGPDRLGLLHAEVNSD